MTTSNHHLYFFGSCCDFRRAVLVMNSISLILAIMLALAAFIVRDDTIEQFLSEADDDYISNVNPLVVTTAVKVVSFVCIAISSIGIYGALKFKKWALVATASIYGAALVVNILTLSIFEALWWALVLYPHIFMIKLMNAGIMTETNYHNVVGCCGGNPGGEQPPKATIPQGNFA